MAGQEMFILLWECSEDGETEVIVEGVFDSLEKLNEYRKKNGDSIFHSAVRRELNKM